jgi:hypothetical protein
MIRTPQKTSLSLGMVFVSPALLGVGSSLRRVKSKAPALLLPRRNEDVMPSERAFDATPLLIVRIKTLFSHASLLGVGSSLRRVKSKAPALHDPATVAKQELCFYHDVGRAYAEQALLYGRELKRIREAILSWSGQTRHSCPSRTTRPCPSWTTRPCPGGQRALVQAGQRTLVRADNTPLSGRTTHPCPGGQRTLDRAVNIPLTGRLRHPHSGECVTLTRASVSPSLGRVCHPHSGECVTLTRASASPSLGRVCHPLSGGHTWIMATAMGCTPLRMSFCVSPRWTGT